ncbi:Hsp20/alpha crystallin family protein [Chryseolinea lacunae]|uniref:Hsp20/alpha crystallin family protein n=1 Tax=Chryseolinea lacunae TaxID=2801331 RepID=A0ABS1KKU9_9BACT|nr:Hsp20/alpha crystallin family protein [Chryseolinea lacunae]MBL0739973.1 Hsp20/alpha crystallin family protein [Chryseolinea lacunae]
MKTIFKPIHSLSHLLNDVADVELGHQRLGGSHVLLSTQLSEKPDSFTVSVPVPGMSREDLDVHIEDNVLVISTKGQPTDLEYPRAIRHEALKYSFVLPVGIDTDRVQAKCRNGLLTINLEKIKTKKSNTVIKVRGQENNGKDNWRMNTLWDKIKSKLGSGKTVPIRSIKYS